MHDCQQKSFDDNNLEEKRWHVAQHLPADTAPHLRPQSALHAVLVAGLTTEAAMAAAMAPAHPMALAAVRLHVAAAVVWRPHQTTLVARRIYRLVHTGPSPVTYARA